MDYPKWIPQDLFKLNKTLIKYHKIFPLQKILKYFQILIEHIPKIFRSVWNIFVF